MISVVICNVDPAKLAAVTASYAERMADEPYEIVAIHDARSLCEGYNRGLARAAGDLIVFSHDDVEILTPDLGGTLRRHLADWDVVGVAGTTRLSGMGWATAGIEYACGAVAGGTDGDYELQLMGAPARVAGGIVALDGVFFAARRDVARFVGFDASTFDGWHGYDTDFTFRCHLSGYRIAVCLDLMLIHFSKANVDAAWLEYDARFRRKHGALLASGGKWLDVRKRLRTRQEIVAAYDFDELQRLTVAVRARAGASSYRISAA